MLDPGGGHLLPCRYFVPISSIKVGYPLIQIANIGMAVDHPSLHWLGEKQPDFELIPRGNAVLEIFNSLDRHAICAYATALRRGTPCQISPQFTHGATHLFIELAFGD